jgi:hypothetical protein
MYFNFIALTTSYSEKVFTCFLPFLLLQILVLAGAHCYLYKSYIHSPLCQTYKINNTLHTAIAHYAIPVEKESNFLTANPVMRTLNPKSDQYRGEKL